MASKLPYPSLLLLFILAGCNGSAPLYGATYPASYAKHWVSIENPESLGLLLEKDGRGRSAGLEKSGPKIGWRVVNGELQIVEYGEEGEHGEYQSFTTTIEGDLLKINPPFAGCNVFRDMNSPSNRKVPIFFDVLYKDHQTLAFVITNNSNEPIVVTGHMGYLTATVGEGNALRHVFEDGFNADVAKLSINDIDKLLPGKSTSFNRSIRKDAIPLLTAGTIIECSITPPSMSQIDSRSKAEASKLAKYFLKSKLTYQLKIPSP